MQSEAGVEEGCHFAGVNTYLLIRYLRANTSPEAIDQLLTDAEETRTADELFDLATWSSYDQVRRLLETTATNFDGTETLRLAAGSGLDDPSMPEMTNLLQSLGSPEALLAMIADRKSTRLNSSH